MSLLSVDSLAVYTESWLDAHQWPTDGAISTGKSRVFSYTQSGN